MRRARSLEFLNLDLEIERTLRRLRKERREGEFQIWLKRIIIDFVLKPIVADNYSGIHRQAINANNFVLKPALINMV